jgi:translocator protein
MMSVDFTMRESPPLSATHFRVQLRDVTDFYRGLRYGACMSTVVWIAIGWAVVLGGVGGVLTTIGPWYRDLKKPSWQPPDWLFGPAWTIILGLAAWAAVLAWNGALDANTRTTIVILYGANFIFHLLWSPLFFTLRRPDWSLIEVAFLWSSVLALLIGLRPASVMASWLIVPYFIWVSFATLLNMAIVKLNRPFAA